MIASAFSFTNSFITILSSNWFIVCDVLEKNPLLGVVALDVKIIKTHRNKNINHSASVYM